MTIQRDLPALAAALNRASLEWLRAELPDVADAVEAEVARGATPADVRRFTERHTGRAALAARIEQAAAHLTAMRATEAA